LKDEAMSVRPEDDMFGEIERRKVKRIRDLIEKELQVLPANRRKSLIRAIINFCLDVL
jgi:hypothetical protein